MTKPRVINHDAIPEEFFPDGATYRTLVGDGPDGSAPQSDPVRIGIQTSPPGYATPLHSHPYEEILTVLDGEGVCWTADGDEMAMAKGTTLILPPGLPHAFRATGDSPLVTYGLHLSGERLVDIHDDNPDDAGHPKARLRS